MTESQWALVQMLDGVQLHDLPNQLGLPDDEIDRIWSAYESARTALAEPAPPAPIDIDALLSPEGPYERGNGQEDSSQLVSGPHGHEWWAPIYGCDTLDNLLDRIRARILPHLRPPIAGIDVSGGDGDYGDVLDLCAAEGVDPRVGVPLLQRAKKAWGYAAQPAAPARGLNDMHQSLPNRKDQP